MNQNPLRVTLNPSFREVFKSGVEGNLNDNIARSLAIAAFVEKRVTLARAAELADKSLAEFIAILSKHNIPWAEYTEETFKEDQEALKELKSIGNNCKYKKG